MIVALDPVELIRGEARPPEWFRCESCGTRARYEVPLPTGGTACVTCGELLSMTDTFAYATVAARISESLIDFGGLLFFVFGFSFLLWFGTIWTPTDDHGSPTTTAKTIYVTAEATGIFVYFWILESATRTPGARFAGTRLIRERTWDSPGLGTGLIRLLAKVLTIATFGLGLAIMLRDPERRALHDRIAGTRVIED